MREWICYRRNYISLSVAVTSPPTSRTKLFTSDPTKVAHSSPIVRFAIIIDSRSQPSLAPAILLQFDPSRKLRLAKPVEPLVIPLASAPPASSPPTSSSRSSYPTTPPSSHVIPTRDRRSSAAFTRLQYRSATANNGKQSHTQERYVAVVRIDAIRDDGTRDEIGRWTSKPFIVRGRSPKNFTPAAGVKRRKEAKVWRQSKAIRGGNFKRKRPDFDWSDEEEVARPTLRDVGSPDDELGVARSKRVRRSAEEAAARLLKIESETDADFELEELLEDSEDDDEYYEA
ncbi:hypothetical protein P7C70_g8501, partial [Phenoliferia sp. Uapishka_3]